MATKNYTSPSEFRSLLRKILKGTLPAAALATALSLGCGAPFTESCPVPKTESYDCPNGDGSPPKHPGTLNRVFEVEPLSKEQCISLCEQHALSLCVENRRFGPRFFVNISRCESSSAVFDRQRVDCDYTISRSCAVAGRRPNGLQDSTRSVETLTPDTTHPLTEVGAFFAELAYLEQAAVTAFDYLARELSAYHAPHHLIAIAQHGVQEEIEHAEMMTSLAACYGATPRPVEVAPFTLRPLHEIAFENVREGCLREAYGATMASWQAQMAKSPAVRAVMARIAHEESAHAALSLAIDEWIKPQLTDKQRTMRQNLREKSLQELERELAEPVSPALVQHAGYPTPKQAKQLFRTLQQELAEAHSQTSSSFT